MGRFNLNQILSDTSKAAAGGGSAKPRPSESRYEKLSVFDLVPSEDNFYSMREIGELKAAIEIAGKVLQNLVVVPLGDGKYKVIAGHRRRLASIELVNGGKPEFVTVEGDRVPQTWVERRPDRRFLQVNSKPLTVPHEVNSWYVAKVL